MRLLTIALAVLLALAALAQAPAGPDAGPGADELLGLARQLDLNTVTIPTPHGVFALRHGVLEKHNARTLAIEGVLPLFGPAPVVPKDGDEATRRKAAIEVLRRVLRPDYLVDDDNLLIVIGARFFRVRLTAFDLAATSTVLEADAVDGLLAARGGMAVPEFMFSQVLGGVRMAMQDGVLTVVAHDRLAAVRTADGQVLERKALDKAMTASILGDGLIRTAAQRAVSTNNLRQLSVAVLMYVQEHAEMLPQADTLFDEIKIDAAALTQPGTDQPYVYNTWLAGRTLADRAIGDAATMVVFYEPVAPEDGSRCAAFLDGHVELLNADAWAKVKARSHIP